MSASTIWRSLSRHSWSFHRTIDSKLDDGGVVQGRAIFTFRNDDEMAYEENGSFTLMAGATFDVRKTYIWRRSSEDELAVHFDEEGERLFHIVRLQREGERVVGTCGRHLCEPDFYDSQYRFEVEGDEITRWEVRHDVEGPAKSYTSVTRYERA